MWFRSETTAHERVNCIKLLRYFLEELFLFIFWWNNIDIFWVFLKKKSLEKMFLTPCCTMFVLTLPKRILELYLTQFSNCKLLKALLWSGNPDSRFNHKYDSVKLTRLRIRREFPCSYWFLKTYLVPYWCLI